MSKWISPIQRFAMLCEMERSLQSVPDLRSKASRLIAYRKLSISEDHLEELDFEAVRMAEIYRNVVQQNGAVAA